MADFWNLFLARQGATLVSHSADAQTVIDRAKRGVSEPYRTAQLAPIGRLTMLQVKGDQLIPVEEATPSAPPVDVASLKDQIAAKDRALQMAKAEAAQAAGLAAKLEEAGRRQARAEAQTWHDALIEAGDEAEALAGKRPLFEQALAVANASGLDPAVASERLNAVRARLAPIEMPAGATAELVRVNTDTYPPSLGLELAVEDAAGRPLGGLTDKDFSVLLNGHRAGVKAAAVASATTTAQSLSLVICLDCSTSMANALPQAKAAATAMVSSLAGRPGLRMKVIGFSSRVYAGAWTSEPSEVVSSISALKASGTTALYGAIGEAISALQDTPGDRRLLVLTDGSNTQRSDHSPTSLSEELRRNQIIPYCIGLQTTDLDKAVLEQLASRAGGFFRMAGAETLRDVFGDAGKKLARRAFRLVVTPSELPQTALVPLAIFVGGGANTISVEARIPLPVPEATAASAR